MPRPQAVVDTFDIAGIPCRVECREPAFARLLAARYAEFAADAVPHLALSVEVTAGAHDHAAAPGSGPFARIGGRAGVLSIDGDGFRGTFDERSGQGRIAQAFDPSPLETFLTAIYARRLLLSGAGFLLHAAAIVAGDRAHVFFGPSGSGKTTVATLVGSGVISDEIAAIRRDGERYRVFGVPWRGQPRSADLGGLFRLRHAPETTFNPLAPAALLRHLLPSVFFPRADPTELGRFFEIAGELVRRVPGDELRFSPDRAFWDAITAREERRDPWSRTTTG